MSLLALQRDFGAWLRDGDADAEGTAPGMRVYQNNYRGSLSACLEEAFAHTRSWIGDEAFERAVVEHIYRVPPCSWTLDVYPRDFPETLAFLYPDDSEVAELAMLELALADAFVGPDAEALLQSDAVNLDWDRVILDFVPTLDLRPANTNAHAIWSALAAETMPPEAVKLDAPHMVLVWRNGLVSHFRLIDMDEAGALAFARSGRSFAALCETMVVMHGEENGVKRAGHWLGRWIADGLLSSKTGDTECAM